MPTAIWTGTLSFGLVAVPVRLYPAVRKKVVRFHELDSRGRRIRHVRVSEPDFEPAAEWAALPDIEVSPPRATETRAFPVVVSEPADLAPSPVSIEETRKGYEVAPGEYVSLTREEVRQLAPERSRVIDVEQFVDVAAVDPIYFESRYYAAPDRDSAAPFQVLRQAMADAGRMAIAWVTLRQRRYLCTIRPHGKVMLLTTMVHADEVLPADFWLPEAEKPSEKVVNMAALLIDTLSGPFEPERFTDEHRQRVLDAIQARTPVQATAAAASPATSVVDLMAALEASVKAAKAERATQEKRSRASRGRSGSESR